MIDEISDPGLWNVLNKIYLSENKPGHVVYGEDIYVVHIMTDQSVTFGKVNPIDYIDSRSLTKSRKASYKNLNE